MRLSEAFAKKTFDPANELNKLLKQRELLDKKIKKEKKKVAAAKRREAKKKNIGANSNVVRTIVSRWKKLATQENNLLQHWGHGSSTVGEWAEGTVGLINSPDERYIDIIEDYLRSDKHQQSFSIAKVETIPSNYAHVRDLVRYRITGGPYPVVGGHGKRSQAEVGEITFREWGFLDVEPRYSLEISLKR